MTDDVKSTCFPYPCAETRRLFLWGLFPELTLLYKQRLAWSVWVPTLEFQVLGCAGDVMKSES